ncbi:MAG: DUF342 domain-containing protein [Planctomycetes bacterium]|nr:DUF342 domain-containing protein [Planctomycetota bacterium]
MIRVELSADGLRASVVLEEPVELAELRAALEEAGVVYGVHEERLQGAADLSRRPEGLGRALAVAHGLAPRTAQPATVELVVDLGLAAGRMDARSLRMDYRERGLVCNVHVGDVVALLHPPVPAEHGRAVDGRLLEAPAADRPDARVGEHLELRAHADQPGVLELVATLDGVVRIDDGGTVSIGLLYEVPGDVGLAVGNVTVEGSVFIAGNVQAGFRVQARDALRVAGSVEDAILEAGGLVEVQGGILGGDWGHVHGGAGVRASFAQNAHIESGGDVVLGSDTRSTIRCSGALRTEGGAGYLRGGEYWAARGLHARELGSDKGAATRVEVGRDPFLAREHAMVSKDLSALRGQLKKLRRAREIESVRRVGGDLSRTQILSVRRSMKAQRELDRDLQLLAARQAALEAELDAAPPPEVRVDHKVFSGVELLLGGARHVVERSGPGGVFRRDPATGEIVSR